MAIDMNKEKLIPLSQLRSLLPPSTRTGRPAHPSAVFRWTRRGLRAGDGSIVKLEVLRAGGSVCSSREAVQRFFVELTARSAPGNLVASVVESENAKISDDLQRFGIKEKDSTSELQ